MKSDGRTRQSHFLGTKIKSLRKRNHLTLQELSQRCVQVDVEAGPSVSYLSMIENGKRVPSERLVEIMAEIFQKDLNWFYDESLEAKALDPVPASAAVKGMPLEPGFLFSEGQLQRAIPELLAQTGTTGRQFAHLLIRAHQETNQNRFPDLERAAESIGRKMFPLSLDDLMDMLEQLDIRVRWFDRETFGDDGDTDVPLNTLVRSFFEAPDTLYINRTLKQDQARLKFDIANHIGHKILHGGDGARAPQVSGGRASGRRHDSDSPNVHAKDVLFAWRDFECSYFAAALLGPKTPMREYLAKHKYSIDCGKHVGLSRTMIMRRMSSVSPYPHWHYFDAYPPGNLRAVYRGNGIPLPWGNMTLAQDPCRHWAVFRMLHTDSTEPSAQISILEADGRKHLYCCESVRSTDAADNTHVLCVGIDLEPALAAQGINATDTIDQIADSCNANGGSGPIPTEAHRNLVSVSKILNIGWVEEGLKKDATIICPRASTCPRDNHCLGMQKPKLQPVIDRIRDSVLQSA